MNQYDVIVVGGGPAGTAAAVTAAKCGAKTLLVEKNGYVGGVSTAGLMTVWCGSSSSGFYRRVREATTEQRGSRWVYNPEMLKSCYLSMLEEAGVELLLHASFLRANRVGQHIESIDVLGAGEVLTLTAPVFIDATGDGYVAKDAGVSFIKGRESDHLMQPMSLMFTVGGVDETKAVYPTFGKYHELQAKMQEYVDSGKIDHPAGHVILIEGYIHGTASVNMTNLIRVDGTDVNDLTRAELLTRRQVPQIVRFLRECVPGYENCYLLQTADTIGVRETLHFEGEYRLNEQDILNQEIFHDWVVSNAAFNFGNHNLTGSGADKSNLHYSGQQYTIPYRSLLAKGLDNLLLAGRNISGTHMAHASYRVMPICMGMGEGAGVAAALAGTRGIALRAVNPKEIQEILMRDCGVSLPEKKQLK
ncbi:MAG: FAD-dependent oxidoreductase [Clostridia bacterium]|nr:FAD-dependent oxidoreductase [Clostridia bacterium]